MSWRTKHDALREHSNTAVEDTVALVDVGGGTPGLPAVDGSKVTGVIAAGGDHGSFGGLLDDDHTQYLRLLGRTNGQTAIGGTAASQELKLRGTSNANLGLIRAQSPIVFDDVIAAVALSPYYLQASPVFATSAGFIGGGANFSPTINFGNGVSIWEGFRVGPTISSSVNLTFAAFTLMQALPRVTSAVSGRNPMNVTVINAGPIQEYTNNSGSVICQTLGMNWVPQLKATASGGTISWSVATCLIVAPKFSSVLGTVINLSTIRGVHGQNPAAGFLQPVAGVETMVAYILVDMNNIAFGGNVVKAAVRSAQAAATNAFFLLQTGAAQSRFVGQVQHRSNTLGSKWGTADTFGIRYNGTVALFEWSSGANLQWQGIPSFSYWRLTTSIPNGLQFDVAKIAFGDIAPLLTRNWFAAFFPAARTTQFAGEWSDLVNQPTGPVMLAHNMTVVAAWLAREPNIVKAGFDLPVAATFWVDTAPTEGDENFGIYAPTNKHLIHGYRRRAAAYAGYV